MAHGKCRSRALVGRREPTKRQRPTDVSGLGARQVSHQKLEPEREAGARRIILKRGERNRPNTNKAQEAV